jgi:alpha-tubulin suppressor-like RCC1 family protein
VLSTKTDGTLWAMGNGSDGRLGLGDVSNRSSPTQIGSYTDWETNIDSFSVAKEGTHSLAIKTDGTMWSWGNNGGAGKLGLGDTTNRSSPTQIGAGTSWSKVTAGSAHAAAIKTDGTMWSWGNNVFGQLGLNDTTLRNSPVQIGAGTTWSNIAVGGYHNIALKTDGTLWSWGYNNSGQLGLGNTTSISSPVQIGALTNWSSTSAASNHCVSIKPNGSMWSWGYNGYGELGLGDTSDRSSPTQIGALTTWLRASAGTYGKLAVKTNGTLWSWGGRNSFGGFVGDGTTTSRSSPVQLGSLTTWSKVAAGRFQSFAISN